jgi:hypothetical protein
MQFAEILAYYKRMKRPSEGDFFAADSGKAVRWKQSAPRFGNQRFLQACL